MFPDSFVPRGPWSQPTSAVSVITVMTRTASESRSVPFGLIHSNMVKADTGIESALGQSRRSSSIRMALMVELAWMSSRVARSSDRDIRTHGIDILNVSDIQISFLFNHKLHNDRASPSTSHGLFKTPLEERRVGEKE